MANYIAPKSDGLKYSGRASFCFDSKGFSKVSLSQPSGHDQLDHAILESIKKTAAISLPEDPCLQSMASHLRVSMTYDETDMLPKETE